MKVKKFHFRADKIHDEFLSEKRVKPLRNQVLNPTSSFADNTPTVSLRDKGRLSSRSGQAVIEYLLVLVVIVGITLGIMYQLNTAFKKYVQSYFGDYVACLLETGELPSLGSGDGASAEICNAEFEPFSLKNGRPLIENSDASGGRGAARSRSSRSSSRGGSPSRVTRNRSTLNADRSRGDSTVSAQVGGTKKTQVGGGSSSNDSYGSYRIQNSRGESIRLSAKFGMGEDKEKQDASKKLTAKGKMAGRSSNKKLLVNMENFKRKPAEIKMDVGFSLGDYLRYILIFAIIIVIIVFFGGQLFQLRKSWDRN